MWCVARCRILSVEVAEQIAGVWAIMCGPVSGLLPLLMWERLCYCGLIGKGSRRRWPREVKMVSLYLKLDSRPPSNRHLSWAHHLVGSFLSLTWADMHELVWSLHVTLSARSPAAVCWIKLIRTCNKCSCLRALCTAGSSRGVAWMLWFHSCCALCQAKLVDTMLKIRDETVSKDVSYWASLQWEMCAHCGVSVLQQ